MANVYEMDSLSDLFTSLCIFETEIHFTDEETKA